MFAPHLNWTVFRADLIAAVICTILLFSEYATLATLFSQGLDHTASVNACIFMLLAAVFVGNFSAFFLGRRFTAGPRAASVAVLLVGLQSSFSDTAAQSVANAPITLLQGVFFIVGVSALFQRACARSYCVELIRNCPKEIRNAFTFITAVSICASGLGLVFSSSGVEASLKHIALFALPVVIYLGCTIWQKHSGHQYITYLSVPATIAVAFVSTLAMDGVPLLATYLNSMPVQDAPNGSLSPWSNAWSIANFSIQSSLLVQWFVWGLLLGVVSLLESVSTLLDSAEKCATDECVRHLKAISISNLIAACLCLAPISYSQSRTNSMVRANAKSSMAPLLHGGLCLVLFFLIADGIGQLPVVVFGVCAVVIALQMIDTRFVRSPASTAHNTPRNKLSLFALSSALCFSFGLFFVAMSKPFGAGLLLGFLLLIVIRKLLI